MNLKLKSALLLLLAAGAARAQPTFQPVPLTLSSFNSQMVVPASTKPLSSASSVNVTMEGGQATNNVGTLMGNTWYEIGTDPAALTTGLPHAGSLVTGTYQTNHQYQLASSWASQNCLFIAPNSSATNSQTGQPAFYDKGTLTLTSPQACAALSFLLSAGDGPCLMDYTVTYADASTQSGAVAAPDWFGPFNNATGAYTGQSIPLSATYALSTLGRVSVTGGFGDVGSASGSILWSIDLALTHPATSVKSISFSAAGSGRCSIFAISAAAALGGGFAPLPVSGYNADVVVEAPANPALFPFAATMDDGTNFHLGGNTPGGGNTWFEAGYDPLHPTQGFPSHGSTVLNVGKDRSYQMAPFYVDVGTSVPIPMSVLLDSNHPVANMAPADPRAYTAYSLLTAGANISPTNTMTNVIVLQHANGTAQTNFFYGIDWLNTTAAPAYIANGRVNFSNGRELNDLSPPEDASAGPRLFESEIQMQDTESPVTNIQVRFSEAPNTNSATYILAVSAAVIRLTPEISWANPAPIAYGSALTAEQLGAMASVGGTLVYSPPLGTVLDAGTNMLSVVFQPTNTFSYTSATDTVSIVVLPGRLTVTANNASRPTGQANPPFTGEITGLVNGDNITAAYSCSATAGSPSGTYAIVPSLVDPDNRQANYTVSLVDGTLAVGVVVPTLTWPTPAPITYGTPLSSIQLDATANVPGSFTYTPAAGSVLNAGTHTLTVVFRPTDTANFTRATNMVSLTVSPAALMITANSRSKTYGQTVTFAGTEFGSSGLVNGDAVTSVALASTGAGATATVAGSPYKIVPSAAVGAGLVNYTIIYADGSLTVAPAALTITANSRSKTYGQAVTFAGTEFTVNGLLNGDSVSSATLNSSGAAATAAVVGSPYPIVASAAAGSGLVNYTINYVSGTLAVAPAALTITANNRSKTYGEAVTFAGTEFGSSGLVNGDAVTSVTLASTGAGTTATVAGSPYKIVPSAAVGAGLVNYTIIYAGGSLTVAPAALTITANSRSKTYGQAVTFAGTEFTVNGLLNGDSVSSATLNSSGAAATAAVVGSPYPIVASAAAGSGLVNYTINYVSGTLAVAPAALTITASNRSKTYGQATTFAGTEFAASGLLNDDTVTGMNLTSGGAAATATVAGSPYNIVPSAAVGTGLANYTITYDDGLLTVAPASLTITANNRAKTYGQTITFAGTEYTTSGLLNGDTVSGVTLNSAGAVATATVTGSPYNIVPSGAVGTGLANYAIAYGDGTLTVAPAMLTITANNRAKTYGQTITFAGTEYTTSGLLNGDTVSGVTLNSSGTAATATVAGSPYNIVPSGALGTGLANYAITYGDGTLTVAPASLTITANDRAKTYGQTVTFAGTEYTTSGLLNSDGVSGVTLNSAGAGAAATVAGGPYSIVPSGALGTGLGNYAISYVNGSLAVNPAGLTVTASGRGKVYGQTVTFVGTEFSTAGLVNGDTVASVTLTSAGAAASATVAGSSYNIVPSAALGTGLANYTVNYVNGALTVSPAGLTVTANSRGKVYGQTVTFAGTEFSTSGLVNSDAVASVTLTSAGAAGSATVAGSSYSIVPSAALGAGLANYTIAYVNGSLAVSPANLTVTANNRTKIYGQTVTFAGTEFVPSGLLNSDAVASVTLTSAGAAASATVAGSSYSIVPSAALGTGLANYTIAYVNGLLAVNRAGLTITANNRAKTYGQTVTFAGTEFVAAGLVNSDAVASVTLTSAGAAASATVAGSPYPIVPSAALGTGLANYAIAYVNGTLTVGEMALTITWPAPAPIIYGAALGAAQLNATASVAGSFVYNPTNGAVLDSGSQTLSVIFTPADTVDYSPMSQSVGLTVSPAPLTVTAANTNRVYGQANPLLTGTIAGVTNGDLITAVYGSSAVPNSPLGPYAIVPSLVDPDNSQTNYTVHLINGVLTVAQAAPALLWTNPAPIVYGAALGAAQLNATASVPGGFAYNLPSGTVLTAGAHQLSVVFTPADTVDYSPVNGTVSLVVLPAPLTVTAASFSRPFGTANPVFTGTITGLANGDNITANYNCSANSASPVGTYPIVPSLLDPDNRQTNYTVNLADGILVVGHPAEAFAWGAPAPIIYGTALSPAQLNAVANVPGVYTYTPASGTVLPSGTYTLAVQFTPTDTVDYTNVTQSVSLVVSPAPLTVAAAATNRAYGQVNPVLTGTITGAAHGDVISAAYHCSATAGSAAGPYPITAGPAVGGGLTNYTIAYVNGTLTVNPASLTVTANNRAKNYGQAATFVGTEFGSSGLVNGDTVTGVTLASAGAAAAAGVAGSPYSIMPSAAVGTGLVNYTITYVNGALTVAPAPLTITANNRSKSYGQTAALAGTGFGSSGLVNGDTVTGVTLASAGAAAGATLAGSPYTIVASAAAGTGLGNYTITYVNGALTVAPAPLTITANSGSKSYGQALLFAGTEITSSGLVNGDTVASATLTSTGAAATATVAGSPYGITVGGAAGTGLVNYTITYANGPLIVTPASLTVTANSRSKIYGQAVTFAGTEITSSGLVNGNTVTSATLASAGAAVTAAVAGSPYNITPSAALGTGLVNYTITYVNGPLTVTPASLTVTAGSRSKIYGQAVTFAGTEITSSGLLNGDTLTSATLTSAGAAVTAAVAGSPYNITPSAALGTGLVNYTIIYASGALTVTPASLTVTASGQSKTYGQALTFAGTEITSSGLLNGDTVTSANLNSAGAAAAAAVAGSPYSIVPSAAAGAGLNNYTIAYANGTLAVNPAALAITANNRAKTYGQAVTFAGTEFASGGLVNGDTVTSVTLTSTGAAAAAAAAGSPYKIVPSAAVGTGLNNYTITYANGSLALTPAALTITANNRSKIYGQTVTFAGTEITTSGLLNGDLVNSATLSSAGAAAVAAVAASPYSIVPSAAVGAGLANYTITYASGALAITPASLTITANNRAKTYGQSTSFAGTEITTSGLLNNDTVSGATLNSAGAAATATVAGSPYPIIPSAALGTGLANYALTYGNGTLTIAPAPLAITANNRSKTYGQTITFAGTEFAAAGLVNNDTVSSATLHSSGAAATAAVAGSPYTIVPSAAVGTGLANYAITYGNGTLTLAPAPLTITANNRSKTYGQAITFAGTEFAAAGLVNNDTVSSATLTSPGAAAAATVAGSPYPIVPSAALGTGLPNYTLSYVNGTLSVSPASLTVTANSRAKTYGQAVTFAGTEFAAAGLANSDAVASVTLTSPGAAATAAVAGSPYSIAPSAAVGTGLVNYTIIYANGTLTVSPANLTVTANNRAKTYGQTVTFAGTEFATAGLANNDAVTSVTLTSPGAAAAATVAGSPYPIVPGAAAGAGLVNYTINYVNGVLTVGEAGLTITWPKPLPIAYGTALSANQLNATANVPGSFNYNPTNGTVLNAGNYTLSVTFAPSDTVNYSSATTTTSLTVSNAPLTVTGANANRGFGQANPVLTGTIVGVTNGDNITASYGTTAAPNSPLGTYPIAPNLMDPGNRKVNYKITLVNGALAIGQGTPAMIWTNPAPIVYGTALNAAQLNATANVSGSFAYNVTNGAVLNTGTNTLSVLFTPTDTMDYTSVNGTVSLVVLPAPLTVTAASFSRPFGTANPGFNGTITGLISGDNITARYNCNANSGSPIGTYPIVPSVADPDNRQTNYTVNLVNGILVVGHPSEVFAWAAPSPIVYGTSLTSLQLNAAANIPGSYAYLPTNGTALNCGTNILSVTFTPTDTVDYTNVTQSVNLVVTPAPLIVTAASTNRIYGQANPVLTGTILGVTNGDTITAPYSCTATAASPAGPYPIMPGVAVGTSLTNYTISYTNGTMTISPAVLTLTANNRTKIYGQTAAFAGTEFAAAGLVNGDAVTSVALGSAGAAVTATVIGSPYNILPSAAVGTGLSNYTINYVNGALKITPASVVVTANNGAKTYGQTANFAGTEFVASGLVNGDVVTSVTLSTPGAAAAATTGLTYFIVPGGAGGTGLGNYKITYVDGTLAVNPAALTITANSRSKTYGQAVTFAGTEFVAAGLANADTVTGVTLASAGASATASATGSPYPIVPSAAAGAGLANYTINYVNGSLTVNPAALTITANNRAKTYGQAVTFAGTEFVVGGGLANADTVTSVTLTCAGATAAATVAAVPYQIVPSAAVGAGLNNYTITYADGSLTVNPAVLTITANNRAKIYGQTVTFAGNEFAAIGLTNADTVTSATLTCAGSAGAATVAGSPYNITPSAASGAGLNNYTITYANGALTVNPASLIVTANNRAKSYGQSISFAGTEYTSAGLLNSDTMQGVTFNSAGAAATATVAGSPYTIVPSQASGAGLGNYAIAYVNGTLTINTVSLTVTASNLAKTYGQTVIFAGTEFTAAGLKNADTVASVTFTSPGSVATATVAGSPDTIVASAAVGTGLNNYSITYLPGSLKINPAALTITANNRVKTFGQTVTFDGTEFTDGGLANADTVTNVILTSAGAASTATVAGSPYAIVPSAAAGTGLANYAIAYDDGVLTVTGTTPAPVIQSATHSGKVFSFTWSATPAQTYQIQSTTKLKENDWINLGGPFTATNSTVTTTDSITNSQTFYRIIESP